MGLNSKSRAWSAAEDEKLTALCKGHSTSLSAGWEEIAQHFEGRSYLACRQRWLNLRRKESGAPVRVRVTPRRANGRVISAAVAKNTMQVAPSPGALPSHASLTSAIFGDPLPGRSALDQKRAGVPA